MQVLKAANDCAFEMARLEEIYGEIHWPITTSLFFHFLATMNNSHRTEENFTTKDQKDN
jgi:hypothetical protein